MELSGLELKNFLHFIKRKLFLYFGKRKPEKRAYILDNGTFLYFRKRNFPSSKNKKTTLKKFLILQEMELSSLKLKKYPIFQQELPKSQKPKFLILKTH